MCRILDVLENRRAKAVEVFGCYDGKEFLSFRSELSGEIVKYPAGNRGFGFDRIFAPDGFNGKTAA